MIEHFYESIPGWFNFQDIYRDAVAQSRDGAVFVEVGSWLGRSTAFMAVEIANSSKAITFYAVDTWEGSPAEQYQSVIRDLDVPVYDVFRNNMRAGGVERFVAPLVMNSVEASRAFADHSLNFVFLDAAHDFRSVSRDVQAWGRKVREGGDFGGHDANCPGLMNAVKQWIPGKVLRYSGTSWVAHREPGEMNTWTDRVGVVDQALEEWRGIDYARRMLLAGATETEILSVIRNRDLPPTPPDRYIAKWGGPPGEETFDFPYGVTTLDW